MSEWVSEWVPNTLNSSCVNTICKSLYLLELLEILELFPSSTASR